MVLPVNRGQFNPMLERHIASGIVPSGYYGNLNPLDDDFWVLLHAYPLSDVDRSFAVITYPQGREGAVIAEGVTPMLQDRFGITREEYNNCVIRFCTFINAYLSHRFNNCDYDEPVTVTSRNATLCITFYPRSHETPILIRDGDETYIVPERAIPGHWIDDSASEMSITWAGDLSDSDEEDAQRTESASMAISGPATASAFAVRKKDPTIEEIGDPCDLGNFLPDSGATQHMTPRRADLFDVVEGQNLGVEVADGHVIKCSITGKIHLQMTDDNGDALNAVLHDVMYVPGLSRRLFSITRFARHGHFATICSGSTTLYFGEQQSPVTLSSNGSRPMAADVTVVSTEKKAHAVPANRNHDHSANKRRTGLELLHQRLGHQKCRAILAASEHGVWADTMVRMGPEDECVSCEVSTARASNRNKEAHTGGNYPGEYVFLDILHPVVPVGLTKESTFPFSLILVDAYSRYACIYGIRDKSSSCVIDALTRYQADHGHIGNYGYLDIARICADSGSQFTSENFREHCRMAGINLTLAAPKKQYQNHLAERSWQSISTMARSLLVHARLPDSFMFHALLYSCHIFNVLPMKGLYLNGPVGTPYELFQGAKPAISQFRVFGCPVTARKWTTKQSSAGKQTQRGIRGIFIGFAENHKGYLFIARLHARFTFQGM
jgi:transposase InsO family protein